MKLRTKELFVLSCTDNTSIYVISVIKIEDICSLDFFLLYFRQCIL